MNVLQLFKNITTFAFDMDGVLTDGSLLLLPGGTMVRKMNTKDGYALQLAVKKGYNILVISGGNSPEAEERLVKLGVKQVHMRCDNKAKVLNDFAGQYDITQQQILFMGDDIPDLGAMGLAGLPCCPNDAVTEIKEISKYISPLKGGEGCVRDVIEKTLKLRGDWEISTGIRSQ